MNAGRFQIRRDAWVRPLLLLFTGTAARARLEVGADDLNVRFGWYTTAVPFTHITGAGRTHWPWYAGLGWRTNFRTVLALVGSYSGVVRIDLDPHHRTRLLGIGFGVRELYVSLEDPDGFLRDLATRLNSN